MAVQADFALLFFLEDYENVIYSAEMLSAKNYEAAICTSLSIIYYRRNTSKKLFKKIFQKNFLHPTFLSSPPVTI